MSENEVFQSPAKMETVTKETGMDIPVESVSLPSQGLLYPPDHPLHGEQAVEIRCMTAREEDLLTSRALFKNGTVLTKLMQACLLNKAIDPDDMLIGDRNALLIAIRVTGYGSEYGVKLACPACNEEYDETFSLSSLKVKSLGAQPVSEGSNLFSFKLPLSGKEVKFKLLTGRDQSEIDKIVEAKKKLGSQVDPSMTMTLLHSIVSVGAETDRSKLAGIVNNLRAGDARALRKYMVDVAPSVDMKQKTTCKLCNEESEVEVPLGLNFFWPDVKL